MAYHLRKTQDDAEYIEKICDILNKGSGRGLSLTMNPEGKIVVGTSTYPSIASIFSGEEDTREDEEKMQELLDILTKGGQSGVVMTSGPMGIISVGHLEDDEEDEDGNDD